jgi:hypothetical protein
MKALITRQEKLVYAGEAGYVSYYQKDGARVAKNASILSVNKNDIYSADVGNDTSITISAKNVAEMKHEIRNFHTTFSNDNFASVYDFQADAQSIMVDIINSAMISEGQAADNASTNGAVTSEESGIVTYYMDNFETVTPETVTSDMFKGDSYQKTNLRTTEKISKNTPIYKIITSELWNLVIPVSEEQYKKLVDKDSISFTILEDDSELKASLELMNNGEDKYAVLTLNKNLSNYLGERFLDVELNFDSVEGLKIPITSIVEKDFYEVPLTYITYGGDSKETGVNKVTYNENGEVKYPFVPTKIYYQDDTYAYIDTQLFDLGTKLQLPKSTDQYTLSKTMKLTGVYNVNQGYAVFKRIEILFQNKEYCIVSDETSNGLSAYDHIVLDGQTAVEQKIIY